MLNMMSSKNMKNRMAMNYLIKIIFLTFFFISFVAVSQGISGTYYVSPDGRASWSECRVIEKPCSQATARSNARSGDIVYYLPGTYTETVRFDSPGVTAKSYIKHEAVIVDEGLSTCLYSNQSNVTFNGFKCYMYNSTGARINPYASNCKLLDNRFIGKSSNLVQTAIAVESGGEGLEVSGNVISNVTRGIQFSSVNGFSGLCKGNYIHSFGTYGASGADGIRVVAGGDFSGLVIEYNEITGWHDDAVDLFGGNNVVVRYNYIHDNGNLHTGTGIKMGGSDGGNNTAYGNYIIDLKNGSYNRGIVSNRGENLIIAYNVIKNTKIGIWIYPEDHNPKINNNYVQANERAIMISENISNVILQNNILDGGDYDLKWNTTKEATTGRNIHVNFDSSHDGLNSKYIVENDLFKIDPKIFITKQGTIIDYDSPTINNGIVLGKEFDLSFAKNTVFPKDIVMISQNKCGAGWEIGPFANCIVLASPYNIRLIQE